MTKPAAYSLSDEAEEGVPEGFRPLLGVRGHMEQLGPLASQPERAAV